MWSPWRMAYIERSASEPPTSRTASPATRGRAAGAAARALSARATAACLFCRVAARATDRDDLVLARRPNAVLMLNRYPYNPAHLMVAIRRHVPSFQGLSPAEGAELLELTSLAERALEAEYRPHGMNAGVNLGHVAGAGIPGHLHLHLVPRWNGDTNFMPVVGETRVLPESLSRTWTRLRRAIRALGAPAPARGARRRRG